MENKVRMSTISTSIADSTDTRVSDLIEPGYISNKLPNEPLNCMSSSVRNFGHAGALFHGLNSSSDGAVFKDCTILDGKHFYERNSEFLKCDSVPWDDFPKVQRTNVATSGTLPLLSSTTGACKFIKDEKEPAVIMDAPCANFDPSPEIPALDTCCDTDRKQLGLSDGESTSFTPSPRLEGSPNYLIDLNQPEQLSQVRTDSSRCGLSNTAQQLTMYKSEVPRWQMQTSPAEPQYWSQSAGMTEDAFIHGGYEGIQSQALIQRNQSHFSAFPG